MPTVIGKKERAGIIRRFASRLKFPQLFLLVSGLFVLDWFVPDPIPFIDEAILGLAAVALGMWRERHDQKTPDMKNITPKPDDEASESQ